MITRKHYSEEFKRKLGLELAGYVLIFREHK